MAFEYKNIDQEGAQILDAISSATHFNRWMYESVEPYCRGKILEIGSGVGNISSFFLDSNKEITLSDIRPVYRKTLIKKHHLNPEKVIDLDLAHPDFKNTYAHLLNSFDSVFALNVIEHIKDDVLALENMYCLLKEGGHMLVLVPAYQSLYNDIDFALEHYRRYNSKSLSRLMSNLAPVKKSFYFNAMGVMAWWIGGKLLRQKTIPESEMKIYNFFVPLFKIIDKLTGNRIGLSIVCVLEK